MEHSSAPGCHKVGPNQTASTGDVDPNGDVVGVLLERIRPVHAHPAAVSIGSAFSPVPLDEQRASIDRMIGATPARAWWGWES